MEQVLQLDILVVDRYNMSGLRLAMFQKNIPISAFLRSFNSSHLVLNSSPTTLSIRAGASSSAPSRELGSRVARFFVHAGLGHDTDSKVPSDMAKVQQAFRHGLQLVISKIFTW